MDKSQYIENLADRIEIEISSRCTIGCAACPRHTKHKDEWNSGFMDIDILKDVVMNSEYKQYVFCGAYGDAIYHPKILDIITFMLGQRKKWFLETNGSHKPKKFWDKLVDLEWRYGCGFIFSMDGLEDTNHIYRKNSDWDSIMYGVNKILSLPRWERPRMKWKYLVFPYNEHQVEDARKFANELGFDEFEAVKSLRNYKSSWFDSEEHHKQIDWNYNA